MNQQKRSTNRFSKPLLMANGEHLISVVPPAAQITPKLSSTIFDKSSPIFFLSEKTQKKGEKRRHFFILKTWNTQPVTETLRFPIETVFLCTKNLTKKNSQESEPKSLLKTPEVHNFLTRPYKRVANSTYRLQGGLTTLQWRSIYVLQYV